MGPTKLRLCIRSLSLDRAPKFDVGGRKLSPNPDVILISFCVRERVEESGGGYEIAKIGADWKNGIRRCQNYRQLATNVNGTRRRRLTGAGGP